MWSWSPIPCRDMTIISQLSLPVFGCGLFLFSEINIWISSQDTSSWLKIYELSINVQDEPPKTIWHHLAITLQHLVTFFLTSFPSYPSNSLTFPELSLLQCPICGSDSFLLLTYKATKRQFTLDFSGPLLFLCAVEIEIIFLRPKENIQNISSLHHVSFCMNPTQCTSRWVHKHSANSNSRQNKYQTIDLCHLWFHSLSFSFLTDKYSFLYALEDNMMSTVSFIHSHTLDFRHLPYPTSHLWLVPYSIYHHHLVWFSMGNVKRNI